MSVSLDITTVNTRPSSRTADKSRGDIAPNQTSEVMASGQSLDSGVGVSDTGKGNPFSNALKKRLLFQISQDSNEGLSSKQEQKAKTKSLPPQEAKTKENASELVYAMAVVPPLVQPRTDVTIKFKTAVVPSNSQLQQQASQKQPLSLPHQGEKNSEQAPKSIPQAMPSLQATVKKNVAEAAPEVKAESAAAEKITPKIETKPIHQNFQPRAVQPQADQSNVVQPAAQLPTKLTTTPLSTQAHSQVQAQVAAATQPHIAAQSQPQIQQNQVRHPSKSSLETTSISSGVSSQLAVKKEDVDKKATVPGKDASGELFQSAVVSQQSQQGIAETGSPAAEKTSVISTDSAGRQDALKPVDQILQHIPTTIAGSFQQIRMTLSPEELGSIRITFRQQDDQVHGIIEVEKSAVQKDIEKAMPQIASAMAENGIQLRRIEVIPMQNNPNSQNNQFSQDFNPSEHRHPTGQTPDQSSGGSSPRNTFEQNGEASKGEIASKSQQVFDNSGLNMYA